jgi:hypothetical protein
MIHVTVSRRAHGSMRDAIVEARGLKMQAKRSDTRSSSCLWKEMLRTSQGIRKAQGPKCVQYHLLFCGRLS